MREIRKDSENVHVNHVNVQNAKYEDTERRDASRIESTAS